MAVRKNEMMKGAGQPTQNLQYIQRKIKQAI